MAGPNPWDGLEDAPTGEPTARITVTPSGGPKPWDGLEEASTSSIPRAFADIPKEIADEFMSGARKVAKRAESDPTKEGVIDSTLNTGSAILGAGQMLFSPITGAARSLIGHPYADLLHEAGKIIAPEIAAKDDPQELYKTGKHAADLAMAGFGSRIPGGGGSLGARPSGVTPPPPAPQPAMSIPAAAERLSEISPTDVPRAIASDNMWTQRVGQGVRNVPVLGDPVPKATGRTIEQLGAANRVVAEHFGTGDATNVAKRIGDRIEGAGKAETSAATEAARRSDEALRNAWRTDVEGAEAGIARQEARAGQEVRTAVGPDMTPQEMGQALIDRLRATEREARTRKDALYARAGEADASIRADEVSSVGARVTQRLAEDGIVVDPMLTPAATRMLDELQRLAQLRNTNRAVGASTPSTGEEQIVGLTVQAIEQARKRLTFLRSAASNDADRRAATLVMRQFDEWHSNAFETALLSGDPQALAAFRQAREANTDWRRRFYDAEDDAGGFVERIVTGEVTPQEVANLIVGSGQVGAKGVGSRLLTRLADAVGGDGEVLQALRSGVWNRLTQNPEGVAAKAPNKIVDEISQFLNGSGSDVAHRLFTADQRARMEAYADALRAGREDRTLVQDIAKATEPTPTEVPKGPAQELSDAIVGPRGSRGEEVYTTIDRLALSKGRGDIQTLAKLLRQLPEQDKGDMAAAMIRNMGKDAETGFSYDKFLSAWKGYTPQAKALMFGTAGPHRKALEDIALISERLQNIHKRFGNPAGTAQNLNIVAMIGAGGGAIWYEPITAISSIVGTRIGASILAKPATAQAAAKWSRAYAAALTRRSAQTNTALQVASKNLAEAARTLGSNVSGGDFMKLLQAPTGRAGEEQNK